MLNKGDSVNKRKKKLKNKYIYLFVVFVVVIVFGMSYVMKTKKELNIFESLIKDTVVLIQKVFYVPIKGIGDTFDDFFSLQNIQEENKILKSNVEKIESLEAENIELKQEINKLKEELNVDYVLSEYDYLNATVISRNSLYWYNTLTIDKGEYHGLEEGMVVINSTGLIGKVVNVSTFSADVKLITTNDTNNKISVVVTNGTNKLTGLINSYNYNEGYLKVEGISNTETVNIGDYVYTSGLGGVFPSGILIGRVESIVTDEYDLSKIINVKPSANFDDINYVTILKRASMENVGDKK